MIFPPLNEYLRESEIQLGSLLKIDHLKVTDFKTMKEIFDTRSKIRLEIFHLQRFIKAHSKQCYPFLKEVVGKKLHEEIDSQFLDTILIMIYLILGQSNVEQKSKMQGKQNLQEKKKKQSISEVQSSRKVSEQQVKCFEQLNNSGSQLSSGFGESSQRKKQQGISEGDFMEQKYALIKNKIGLIRNVIIQTFRLGQRNHYVDILHKDIDKVQKKNQKTRKIYRILDIIDAYNLFQQMVESNQIQNVFEPELFCFIMKEYAFAINNDNLKLIAQIRLKQQKKEIFNQKQLKYLPVWSLIEIAQKLKNKRLPNKAFYYAQMGYKQYPYIPRMGFIYGYLLLRMGELEKAKVALRQALKNQQVHDRFNFQIYLAEIEAKLGRPQKVAQCLCQAKKHFKIKCEKDMRDVEQNKDNCVYNGFLVSDRSFMLQTINIQARAWLNVGNYQNAIATLTKIPGEISAKGRIYLMWAYYNLKKYKQCEEQLSKPFYFKMQDIDPLEYIDYLKQCLSCQDLSSQFKQKIKEILQPAQHKLKLKAEELLKFGQQLLARKEYQKVLDLTKYIEKYLQPHLKIKQILQKLVEVTQRKIILRDDQKTIGSYSLEKLEILQSCYRKEGVLQENQLILAEYFLKYNREKGNRMLREGLQRRINFYFLHVYLNSLKLSPLQQSQDIVLWLEKLNSKKQIHENLLESNELHIGDLLKRRERYQQALGYYQKRFKRSSQFVDDKMMINLFECYFMIANIQGPKELKCITKMKELVQNYFIKTKKQSKSSQFLAFARKIILKKCEDCFNQKTELDQSQKNEVLFYLNLALIIVTDNQLKIQQGSFRFVPRQQFYFFPRNIIEKKQERQDFKGLLQKASIYCQKQMQLYYEYLITLLDDNLNQVDRRELFYFYCTFTDCKRAVPIFRQLLDQVQNNKVYAIEIKTKLINVRAKNNHVLTLVLAIIWQHTINNKQKIKEILQKIILPKNIDYDQWRLTLYIKLKEVWKQDCLYLLQVFQNQ